MVLGPKVDKFSDLINSANYYIAVNFKFLSDFGSGEPND
jgi:hypothetical protein